MLNKNSIIEYENLYKSNELFMDEYKKAFEEILLSGWFILGKNVQAFENEFATYCGSRYCIGVASGLDALTMSLHALDLPRGAEIIVPSNTYIATILSIVHLGFKPILVEPDIRTYNIDANKIEEKITAKTKAIMVVHLYGKCCEMDKIVELAKIYNLHIIEDCAQAQGAKFKGQAAGSFGDFGAHSFYPTKNLGALGDSGAITTNNEDSAKRLKRLRNYGSDIKYQNEEIGFNSRLHEVQAAMLRIKLKHLDIITNHKRKLAEIYDTQLINAFVKPIKDEKYYDVYHIYNIRHPKRDLLRGYLLENSIKTEIHYPIAPNRQKAMKGILDHLATPIAEEIHHTTLSLPISFGTSAEEAYRVCEVMNKFES
jgi:dTDP-4-amino-4,6-dideoxygalactose transaminase